MEKIVIYLLMVQKYLKLKQKILRLQQLRYVQEIDNMKKTGFNGYVYDFSVGYDDIKVDNVKDIHKYLMKKNNII